MAPRVWAGPGEPLDSARASAWPCGAPGGPTPSSCSPSAARAQARPPCCCWAQEADAMRPPWAPPPARQQSTRRRLGTCCAAAYSLLFEAGHSCWAASVAAAVGVCAVYGCVVRCPRGPGLLVPGKMPKKPWGIFLPAPGGPAPQQGRQGRQGRGPKAAPALHAQQRRRGLPPKRHPSGGARARAPDGVRGPAVPAPHPSPTPAAKGRRHPAAPQLRPHGRGRGARRPLIIHPGAPYHVATSKHCTLTAPLMR
jgi:hypothetical protein